MIALVNINFKKYSINPAHYLHQQPAFALPSPIIDFIDAPLNRG
jgi:hypothetical protein